MFGISFFELFFLFFLALVLFGPENLPKIARTLGDLAATMRKHSDAFRREFYNSVYKPAEDLKRNLLNDDTERPKEEKTDK